MHRRSDFVRRIALRSISAMQALQSITLAALLLTSSAAAAPQDASPAVRAIIGEAAPVDTYRISLSESAAEALGLADGAAGSGRLILFFLRDGRRLGGARPIDAPFYRGPQPVASLDVPALAAGTSIEVRDPQLAFPGSLDLLDGTYRVQALYRRNREERSHWGPGNLYGPVALVELSSTRADEIELALDTAMRPTELPERPNLKWIDFKSERLSAFYGREVRHRAGVVFPRDYDKLDAKRRIWPTLYVIPGFGGDHRDALNWASMMATPGSEALAPQMVVVVLDPNGPLGHHGFADSENNGPRGEALVRELIPALEDRFRLEPRSEARIVSGHSSGGWSSLWLQLHHPEIFGACFASAPDPVDFSAFQMSDLYRDQNLFVSPETGLEQPSYREPLSPTEDRVWMTVREEIGVEHVLGPRWDSGEQWGSWAAMFSGRDPATRAPRDFVDPETGDIVRSTIEEDWSRYDIARLVRDEWPRSGEILEGRIRLVCGGRDSYYLHRAVERLATLVETLKREDVAAGRTPPAGPGYIDILPRASHETIVPMTTVRFNEEMREHLRRHGLHE